VTGLCPITRPQSAEQAAHLLLGRQLAGVAYLNVAAGLAPNAEDRAHALDQALVLSFAEGDAVVIAWAMDGWTQGLSIVSGKAFRASGVQGATEDVGAHMAWRPLQGRTITSVSLSWHVAEPDRAEPTIWALCAKAEGGLSFAVALGELETAKPTYDPTSLIVLFDDVAIRNYVDRSDEISAFGIISY
jgi:hypothetical protein